MGNVKSLIKATTDNEKAIILAMATEMLAETCFMSWNLAWSSRDNIRKWLRIAGVDNPEQWVKDLLEKWQKEYDAMYADE